MICGFVLKALYSGLSPETTASLSSVNDLARSFSRLRPSTQRPQS
jgi:hypothetical protein